MLLFFLLNLAYGAEISGPCAQDVGKFCSAVPAGNGAVANCLKSHESELSEQCLTQGGRLKANLKAFHSACGGDIQKFCSEIEAGGGRIRRCLRKHSKELSPQCTAWGKNFRNRPEAVDE